MKNNIVCLFCGSTLSAELEYYWDDSSFAGLTCDNYKCDAAWDKNLELIRGSYVCS